MGQASNNVKRILVVEDEPAIGEVCARTLRAEGFRVDVASSGKGALDVLSNKSYDLRLIDIRTPEINSIELYQHLYKEYTESINKVTFATGDVSSDNIMAFLQETSRPFLTKPFTPDQLRAIVRAVLGLNQTVLGKQHV